MSEALALLEEYEQLFVNGYVPCLAFSEAQSTSFFFEYFSEDRVDQIFHVHQRFPITGL